MVTSMDRGTALVTGASRGIGLAVAAALAASGWRVAMLARTASALEEAAGNAGNGAFAVVCDLADPASIAKAIERVNDTLGAPPDLVVNNAGLFMIRAVEDTSVSDFTSLLATNLTAPFVLVSAFLGAMRARGSGHVVTIGSVADRHVFSGNGAYAATKHGARALHEVLREETRGTGIRTTLISPSAVNTDLWESIHFLGATEPPDRGTMLPASAVADAVLFAVTQPGAVNVDELRISRA